MESEKRKAIEQLIEQHKEEISLLQENHNIALSEVKKKQWVILFYFKFEGDKITTYFVEIIERIKIKTIFICFFKFISVHIIIPYKGLTVSIYLTF